MDYKTYKEWLNEEGAKANFGIFMKNTVIVLVDLAKLQEAYEKIKNNPSADKNIRFQEVYDSNAVVSMLDVRPTEYAGVFEIRSSFTQPDLRQQGHSRSLREYAISTKKIRSLTTDPESNTDEEKIAWERFSSDPQLKTKKLKDGRIAVSGDFSNKYGPYETAFSETVNNISNGFTKKGFMKQDIPLVLKQVAEKLFMDNVKPKDPLEEAKLSKYWQARAKKRALRAKRPVRNKKDKDWALEQQEKSSMINAKFRKLYEEEIEMTEELVANIDEFLKKVKEEKLIKLMAPTTKNLKNRPKPKKIYTKAFKKKKFKGRMDDLINRGIPAVGPAGQFGPVEEEKGDGKSRNSS